MSFVQCTNYKKYGHKEDDYWSKDKKAQYAEQEEDEYLFMTYISIVSKGVWYLDSACSNHMTRDKEKFTNLDKALKLQVRLGDDNQVKVEGKDSMYCERRDRPKSVVELNNDKVNRMLPVISLCADVVWRRMNLHRETLKTAIRQSIRSFPVGKAKRVEERLEVVHADICGPMRTESHADNGGVLLKEFNRFCDEYAIKRELTTPYTPEQNDIAECKNRTIVEMAR
ncbi:retrovirus-related pol polyprotein from transposon TNT 1-94 [Tanacetum coccineum]